MQPAIKKLQYSVATTTDLAKIEHTWTGLRGVETLPKSVRPWVYWLTAVVKLGYRQIRAPIWAITKSCYQGFAGNNSQRSTYRALAWLAKSGYVRRRQLRLGNDCLGCIIDINLDRFLFFTQSSKSRHNQIPTLVIKGDELYDTDAHLPVWQGEKLTNKTDSLELDPVLVGSTNGSNKSKTHAKNIKTQNRVKHRYHPIVYTCKIVTEGMLAARRSQILFAVSAALASRGQLEKAIDWEYWSKRWLELSHIERESVVRREILPHLSTHKRLKTKNRKSEPEKSLNRLINSICDKKTFIKQPNNAEIEASIPLDLPRKEREILLSAQKKLLWARFNKIID